MAVLDEITALAGRVPAGVWATLVAANVVRPIAMWRLAGRRLRWAGQRTTHPDLLSSRARAKDTALTAASMIPAALFWAMVLAGSLHGLVAFGRDVVGWHDGWE